MMQNIKSIACLGPDGTYSSLAAKKFLDSQSEQAEIVYFDRIEDLLSESDNECSHYVIPMENSTRGFITESLEIILNSDLSIVGEVSLPVSFSFVYNCQDVRNVRTVFVHSVARVQVSEFLASLGNADVILSGSNISSYERYLNWRGVENCGAIVPQFFNDYLESDSVMHKVNDRDDNVTRFLVLERAGVSNEDLKGNCKNIIAFSSRTKKSKNKLVSDLSVLLNIGYQINSIFPIPSQVDAGEYSYFVEIEGDAEHHSQLQGLFGSLGGWRLLGSY